MKNPNTDFMELGELVVKCVRGCSGPRAAGTF